MINSDRPPRDIPSPIESQDVMDDTTRGTNVPGRDEGAACRDFPGEGPSDLSIPEVQEGYFSVDTREPDPSSSSHKTIADTVQSVVSQILPLFTGDR